MKTPWLYIIILMHCQPSFAQIFPSLKFSRITTKEGISNNRISTIEQDREGFIWAGSTDGLNRLDGYRVKNFFHRPKDSNTLINNFITGIKADRDNNLWVTTREGMSCYQRYQNRFTNFIHEFNGPTSQSKDFFRAISYDSSSGKIWASVSNALVAFDKKLTFKEYPINEKNIRLRVNGTTIHFLQMYQDNHQHAWALFENKILKLDPNTKDIVQSFEFQTADLTCMIEDGDNQYWVGSYGQGLLHFDANTGHFKKIDLPEKNSFIHSIITWIDRNNHPWVVLGTNLGLILLDPISLKSKMYMTEPSNELSILPGNINCLFVDNRNILWIGTENGLSYIEPSKQAIEVWQIWKTQGQAIQSENFVCSFLQDSNGYWAGKWTSPGLTYFDSLGNPTEFRLGMMVTRMGYTYSNNVYAIAKIDANTLLLSMEWGLIEYSTKSKKSIRQTIIDRPDPGLRTIVKYNDSLWWIRTRNNGPNGIFVYNSHSHKIINQYHYIKDCQDCLPPNLLDLLITRNKKIFTTPSNNYLYVFDEQKNRFSPFFTLKEQIKECPSSNFTCMTEGPDGMLWVGTHNGLIEIDPNAKKVIKNFSGDSVIGGIEIENLCFDNNNHLWINTVRNLCCLNTLNNQVFSFSSMDGLPRSGLEGFLQKGNKGDMFSGDIGAVVKFNPLELLTPSKTSSAVISEALIQNQPIPIVQNERGEKKITLRPWENTFSVEFSVLNYDNPFYKSYHYKLDGAMSDWKESSTGHLSFLNLSPGEYVLHVKGGDKFGKTSDTEDLLHIELEPYWWQTKWFFAVMTLSALMVFYFYQRKRIKIIEQESLLKTKLAQTEMMALRAQMNPHFIFNCMNIIDGLITNNRKEEAKQFLQKFSKLVRLVLENSQHQLVPLQSDLKGLELYTEMEAIRHNHQFRYIFDIDPALLNNMYKIPPLLLQPFVENAIVHGLRHKEGKEGKLYVLIKKEKESVIVIIEDDGVGRAESGRINKENNKTSQQIGIRLTAKRIELIEAMNPGKIAIQIHDLPLGTKVILRLPLEFTIH